MFYEFIKPPHSWFGSDVPSEPDPDNSGDNEGPDYDDMSSDSTP
jgi:hypothetical protein